MPARTGRRVRTRHRLSEAAAAHQLIAPVRIDYGAIVVEPVVTTPSGHWRSGLEQRDDGAMMPAG